MFVPRDDKIPEPSDKSKAMMTEKEELDISMTDYGSTSSAPAAERRESAPSLVDAATDDDDDDGSTDDTPRERVAFRSSTKDYHHDHSHSHQHSPRSSRRRGLSHDEQLQGEESSMTDLLREASSASLNGSRPTDSPLRRIAIDLSLWINIAILLTKIFAYAMTLSLSVLAALTDSVLDVVSQLVLNYTERHSSLSRSSALYPAGAARLEPLGVLICAALMGMASFEIIKESCESLLFDANSIAAEDNMASILSMVAVVGIKLALWALCNRAARTRVVTSSSSAKSPGKQSVKVADPTLEALAQDHWNDCLSNAVAAVALSRTCELFAPGPQPRRGRRQRLD